MQESHCQSIQTLSVQSKTPRTFPRLCHDLITSHAAVVFDLVDIRV